jgi:hypothetical protein
VEPLASSDEDAATEPLWAVVAVGSAAIWSHVVVTVGQLGVVPIVMLICACAFGVAVVQAKPATSANARNSTPRICIASERYLYLEFHRLARSRLCKIGHYRRI